VLSRDVHRRDILCVHERASFSGKAWTKAAGDARSVIVRGIGIDIDLNVFE
jgi:hypothetical protein